MIEDFDDSDELVFGRSLYELGIAILTFVISMWLNYANTWKLFTRTTREFLTDYSVFLAVVICIAISYFWQNMDVTRVTIPDPGEPTYVGRTWMVSFAGMKGITWLWGALSAIPIVFFFFMD